MSAKNKTIIMAEPGKQELFITREFDAPGELVFKAHTDPKLFVQWLGPRGYEMKLETFEPFRGGRYRYLHKDKEGNEYGFVAELAAELMQQAGNLFLITGAGGRFILCAQTPHAGVVLGGSIGPKAGLHQAALRSQPARQPSAGSRFDFLL